MKITDSDQSQSKLKREMYVILQQADYDMQRLQFNTVVSAAMKLFNLLQKAFDPLLIKEGLHILLRILAPIAPHITHVLWRELGFTGDILTAGWPQINEVALQADIIEMVVQVNGKLRAKITVPVNAERESIEQIALADKNVIRFIKDKNVKRIIMVPQKLVNIVV